MECKQGKLQEQVQAYLAAWAPVVDPLKVRLVVFLKKTFTHLYIL